MITITAGIRKIEIFLKKLNNQRNQDLVHWEYKQINLQAKELRRNNKSHNFEKTGRYCNR